MIQLSGRLAIVVFEGEVSLDDERAALAEFQTLPGVDLNADILVDRRRASMGLLPSEIRPLIELARDVFPTRDERPRMAVIAPQDCAFGMAGMLELTGGDEPPHRVMVVRNLEDACKWLGVHPQALGP